jgi:hypothetical protein
VQVVDPDTGQGWQLRLRYVRSETEGPLFDRMALRIEAIASYCGLKGIFKLRAADVYEVLSIEPTPEEPGYVPERHVERAIRLAAQNPVFTMKAMQDLAGRIHRAACLEELVDSILQGLEESFGFKYSMILVPTDEPGGLVVIASHGYPESGAGAEMRVGEGIGGMVAEARKPIRISGLVRGMMYAYAMHHASEASAAVRRSRQIQVPRLANSQSLLGVPLLVRGELVGVLVLESELPYRFHEEDKASIELLGSYLAIAMQNMQMQERSADVVESASAPPVANETARATAQPPQPPASATPRSIVYYNADECILVDGEYLIRSLPAKILWRLLNVRQSTGRAEFTNRELRLDKSLNLPDWKDNLESRLLLLRRRLEQKCPDMRLVPRARGRFALETQTPVALSEKP